MARPVTINEKSKQVLANRLAKFREDAQLSQTELANKAGISFSTIQKIEQSKLYGSRAIHEKLAAALNVTIQDLLNPEPLPAQRKPELEPASVVDIKDLLIWLADKKPTKRDVAEVKKLIRSYFRETP